MGFGFWCFAVFLLGFRLFDTLLEIIGIVNPIIDALWFVKMNVVEGKEKAIFNFLRPI